MIISPCRGHGNYRPDAPTPTEGRGCALAVEIDKESDLIYGRSDDSTFFLDSERFAGAIQKPVIYASDAHTIDEIGNKFTWIKSDTTFEGLRQTIYEPKERVKIQQDNPEESETYVKIGKLTVNLPSSLKIKDKESGDRTDFCVRGEINLAFSNNLTCIIGGRGSGKSTLGHLLYNCIGKSNEKLSQINSPLLNLELPPSPLNYLSNNCKCNGPEQTEFFFQNEIEKSARDLNKMSLLITTRLERLSSTTGENLESIKNTWQASKEGLNELIGAYENIVSIDNDIKIKENEIDTLSEQTQVITSEEYKTYQEEIKLLSDTIGKYDAYKTEYVDVLSQIDRLITNAEKLKWEDEQGNLELIALVDSMRNNKVSLNTKFEHYKQSFIKQKYDIKLSRKKTELQAFLEKKNISPENIQELTNANQTITKLNNDIAVLKRKKEPNVQKYENRDAIISSYQQNYNNYKKRYEEVSRLLQSKLESLSLSNIGKAITFQLENDFDSLQNVTTRYVKESIKEDNIKDNVVIRLMFNGINIEEYIKDKLKIREKIYNEEGAEKHLTLLKELVNKDAFLEKLHLQMINEYFDIQNIRAQTKYGGNKLRNTSFGERCAIVISIIIAAGTNPILIDQPEDHLDGRFIATSMVPLLREQKHNRQIILITRDANIVIGGDAELINILNENGNKTDVIPSTIENTKNRQKYIWILDGGEVAFKKREQKYNID